ncbi:MAG: hypothetical protein ACD_43C00113G0003 [uncultured bacterium]|nr:MAG: hypothetical protein ACD_43C00113G0003 [uncultured bacterium]
MREYLFLFFDSLAFIVSCLGVLIIIYGVVFAIYHLIFEIAGQAHRARGLNVDHIRMEFGRNIILALEFIVAADIIETVLEPDYYDIGLLAALVIMRVVLSYFLNKELISLTPPERSKLR